MGEPVSGRPASPLSLPQWNRAFALLRASPAILTTVVQRPASHRGKLGGVMYSIVELSQN